MRKKNRNIPELTSIFKKNNKNLSVAYHRDQILQAVDILTHNTAGQFYAQPETQRKEAAAVLFSGGINTTCSSAKWDSVRLRQPPKKDDERRTEETREGVEGGGSQWREREKEKGNKRVEHGSVFILGQPIQSESRWNFSLK